MRASTRALLAPATLVWAVPLAVLLALPLVRRDLVATHAVAAVPLVAALALAAVTDARTKLVPDVLTLPALAWALVAAALHRRLGAALVGVVAAGGLVLLAAVLTRGGVGGGDVKLAAVLGAALGWQTALVTLALSQLVGGALVVVVLLLRRGGRRTAFPIGAVLAILGALVIATQA